MDDRIGPKSGIDDPRNYQEFVEWFGDEAACRSDLQACRWPQGFQWPQCEKKGQPWMTARGYPPFRNCGAEESVTAGTHQASFQGKDLEYHLDEITHEELRGLQNHSQSFG